MDWTNLDNSFGYVWFFIVNVWNVITSNVLLSIPIAMMILWYALDIIKNLFKILKKGE